VPMRAYQQWCQEHAPNKIPNNITFMGNCQYNSDLQWMPGPHGPHEAQRNTSGCYSIVSRAYGGWTFERPHTLTSEDMEMLGVPEDKVRSRGVGHATYTLSPAAVAHLEHLMKQAPLQPGPASAPLPPMTSKPCRGCRGGKRTRRLPSHQQRQRRAQTRRA
jgi:hypothetical protein